jgi:signal transduction histidine kinase
VWVGWSYCGGVTVLLRPFRVQTWRELAYLLLGGVVSVVAFAIFLAGAVATAVLLVTLVGVAVFVVFAFAARGVAWVERRRAVLVLGEQVEGVYRRPTRSGFLALLKSSAADPQTWKDLGWLVIVSLLGFGFAVAAAVVWAVTGWALTYWTYWWLLPKGDRPKLVSGAWLDPWGRAGLVAGCGVLLLLIAPWVCAALAQAQAQLARVVLGPSDRQRLAGRVDELSRTRAAAADAQAAELRRIERDLHDGAQARLVSMSMDLGLAQEKLESDPDAARELVDHARSEARTAIVELRQLVSGIYPAVLADRGLDAALSNIATTCPVPVRLDLELPERLPAAVEVAAYFVVAEALANIAKHAEATRAMVRIWLENGVLAIEVTDDGRGGADATAGTGLSGLADRVAALDGRLRIASPAGGPTLVRAEIPCVS